MKRLSIYNTILLFAAALSGSSCALNSTHDSNETYSAIGLYAYDIADADFRSRATSLWDAAYISSFGVFAYDDNGAAYINNEVATYTNPTWEFSPARYWIDGYLNFICYAPYPTSANGLSVVSLDDNKLDITYEVPTDVTLQPDLTTAQPQRCCKDDGYVKLSFTHKLSGIILYVAGNTDIEVTSVTIKDVYCKSTLSLGDDGTTYSWATPTIEGGSFEMGLLDYEQQQGSEEYNLVTATDGYLKMLPQTIPSTATITVNATNSDDSTIESVFSFGDDAEWVEGLIYAYSLTFEEDSGEIRFTNIKVIPWGEYVDGGLFDNLEDEVEDGNLILPSQISVSGWTENDATDLN